MIPFNIIEHCDDEDKEGIIVYLEQQKAIDRMVLGWLDFVMKELNFGNISQGFVATSQNNFKFKFVIN